MLESEESFLPRGLVWPDVMTEMGAEGELAGEEGTDEAAEAVGESFSFSEVTISDKPSMYWAKAGLSETVHPSDLVTNFCMRSSLGPSGRQ